MVYLDYSATVPPFKKVKENLQKLLDEYVGNPNALHELGVNNQILISEATKQIADFLRIKPAEIIYTSGATESNNHALKVLCEQYQHRGRKILTTELEHPSVNEPLEYLKANGFQVEYLTLKNDGTVDLNSLEKQLTNDVILVSVGSVNSETGVRQPIEKIGKLLENYQCFFHSDVTQSIGKEKINLTKVDLAAFSAHKFGGLKGIGVLYKKEKLALEPLIHGGASINNNRAGTPPLELIVSMALALRLSYQDWEEKYQQVQNLQKYLVTELQSLGFPVNYTKKSLPHIVNFSFIGTKPSVVQQLLANDEIYISTQTACARSKEFSTAVKVLTNDEARARHSLRISLAPCTTKEEITCLIAKLKKIANKKI